jgi:hypothetical protein
MLNDTGRCGRSARRGRVASRMIRSSAWCTAFPFFRLAFKTLKTECANLTLVRSSSRRSSCSTREGGTMYENARRPRKSHWVDRVSSRKTDPLGCSQGTFLNLRTALQREPLVEQGQAQSYQWRNNSLINAKNYASVTIFDDNGH